MPGLCAHVLQPLVEHGLWARARRDLWRGRLHIDLAWYWFRFIVCDVMPDGELNVSDSYRRGFVQTEAGRWRGLEAVTWMLLFENSAVCSWTLCIERAVVIFYTFRKSH